MWCIGTGTGILSKISVYQLYHYNNISLEIAVALFIILTVVLVIAIAMVIKSSSNNGIENVVHTKEEINVAMQRCEAYDIIQLSKQRVKTNQNPAYGEIGTVI